MDNTFLFGVLIALVLLLCYYVFGKRTANARYAEELLRLRKEQEVLRAQYESLLNGGDKRAALKAGRAYRSALRSDRVLTVYDEQAIANDLSTMT